MVSLRPRYVYCEPPRSIICILGHDFDCKIFAPENERTYVFGRNFWPKLSHCLQETCQARTAVLAVVTTHYHNSCAVWHTWCLFWTQTYEASVCAASKAYASRTTCDGHRAKVLSADIAIESSWCKAAVAPIALFFMLVCVVLRDLTCASQKRFTGDSKHVARQHQRGGRLLMWCTCWCPARGHRKGVLKFGVPSTGSTRCRG